jgi:hypothetical protein
MNWHRPTPNWLRGPWPKAALAPVRVASFPNSRRWGRKPLLSLARADAGRIGAKTSQWQALLTRLQALKLCGQDTVVATAQRWWFGRLIANADMHTGNLSLLPQHGLAGAPPQLHLAPCHDMLPMLHAAPPGGELPLRTFNPPSPLPGEQAVWQAAAQAACLAWDWVAQDERVSPSFRSQALSATQAMARAARSAGG